MGAEAESQMVPVVALQVEGIRLGELPLVAVGGTNKDEDRRVCRDSRATYLELFSGASKYDLNGRIIAQDLFDQFRNEVAVASNL